MQQLRGYLFILAAAFLWACIGPAAKIAFSQGLTPLEVAFWRAVTGWFFFFCHGLVINKLGIQRADLGVVIVFALLCVTAFYSSYQLAVDFGGAARAAVLLYTAPAWVAVMAALFLKEKIGPGGIAGILLSMAGVGLISLSGKGPAGDDHSLAGVLFGLAAGLTYALYYIFGKLLFARYHPVTILMWILILGAAALAPFTSFSVPTAVSWMVVLFLGFFSTYLAYFFYAQGLMRLNPSFRFRPQNGLNFGKFR